MSKTPELPEFRKPFPFLRLTQTPPPETPTPPIIIVDRNDINEKMQEVPFENGIAFGTLKHTKAGNLLIVRIEPGKDFIVAFPEDLIEHPLTLVACNRIDASASIPIRFEREILNPGETRTITSGKAHQYINEQKDTADLLFYYPKKSDVSPKLNTPTTDAIMVFKNQHQGN